MSNESFIARKINKIKYFTERLILNLNLKRFQNTVLELSFIQKSDFYFQVFTKLFTHSSLISERNNINYFQLDN